MVLLTSSKALESVCGSDSAVFHFCHFSVGTFGTNFPRLIVNQFKWLDGLLDSQVGTDGTATACFSTYRLEHLSGGLSSVLMLIQTGVSIFTP